MDRYFDLWKSSMNSVGNKHAEIKTVGAGFP